MTTLADRRFISHLDLDTFFVSVARLDNSDLMGKPVIVGGLSDRGIVASCSYETRAYGVHTGMPMKIALRLCPEAKPVKGDFDRYSKLSRDVGEIIREQVPLYEKTGIDEFYADLTGMDRYFGCSLFMSELQQRIANQTGLPISYALASNKLISKVATNENKPNGHKEVPFGTEREYLAPLVVQKLPGVGEKTSSLLRQMGVTTIKILSEIPRPMMQSRFGKPGIEMHRRSHGIDESPVIPYSEQKSIGTEEIFENDTIDIQFLHRELVRMTEKVSFQLRQQKKLCGCVTIKLRYADFNTETKQAMISYTSSDDVLLQTAKELFKKVYDRRQLVRLLGVRLSHLVQGQYQIDIFNDTVENIRLYQAMDHIRNRFGEDAVHRSIAQQLNAIEKERYVR
ncbi:DNA polymerase IV [Mucilaginibacter sp. HC2]|uniref:DNA polymerase IV n=1 Tax=Mucilaginibacter inviolabilis TaxID=2714892 RepID=UPI0014073469|nr:DNA polymerase IV [Mucilaginibacter inviolabilis]NHA04223.1 DNA polymerase IV [Mucilaginibacter inviolabilis]